VEIAGKDTGSIYMSTINIEEWLPLVKHVATRKFPWLYGTSGYSGQARRSVDPEDVEQEGSIALAKAIESFDETRGVSFKTFAYHLIYRAMARYLGNTCSVLTTGRVTQNESFYTDRTFQMMRSALNYRLFTEMEVRGPGGRRMRFDRADEDADPALQVERKEFIDSCIKKLQSDLTIEEWEMLERKMSGESFATMAPSFGMSQESVRRKFHETMTRCQVILYQEGVLLNEDNLRGDAI
jgi:RNA polymerase sigma factor (sigma-70 family)